MLRVVWTQVITSAPHPALLSRESPVLWGSEPEPPVRSLAMPILATIEAFQKPYFSREQSRTLHVYSQSPFQHFCFPYSYTSIKSTTFSSFPTSFSLSLFLSVITQSFKSTSNQQSFFTLSHLTLLNIKYLQLPSIINMFSSTFISTVALLAALASAAPAPVAPRACHDCLGPAGPPSLINPVVNIEVVTSLGLDPVKVSHLVPTSLNIPTPCDPSGTVRCSASEIILSTVANTTDVGAVECRIFSDLHATVGSTIFDVDTPFPVSTNTDFVGSWLCYVKGWSKA